MKPLSEQSRNNVTQAGAVGSREPLTRVTSPRSALPSCSFTITFHFLTIRGCVADQLDRLEAVQEAKRDCRNGKEVEGDDGLSVMLEEGQPTLRSIASATHSPQGTYRRFFPQPTKPSFRSSPWIFGAPQPVFSEAIRRIGLRFPVPL